MLHLSIDFEANFQELVASRGLSASASGVACSTVTTKKNVSTMVYSNKARRFSALEKGFQNGELVEC